MRQKSGTREPSSERLVKNIRRVTRKQYSSEEKIRIVLDGLRGEFSIAELCRREGIAEGVVTLLNDRAVNWHRTQAQAVAVAVCHRPIAWSRNRRNVFREIR